MFSKPKMFITALLVKLNLEDEFFEELDEDQQQLIDCMILEMVFRLEAAGTNNYLRKIAIAWAVSVYGRDAARFLVRFHNIADKQDIERLCDMYLENQ